MLKNFVRELSKNAIRTLYLQKVQRPIEKNIDEAASSNQHSLQLEFGVVVIINF